MLIGLVLLSGNVTPKPLIPNAETPKVCLLFLLPQTIAMAGITETPLLSFVTSLIGPSCVVTAEDKTGEEKNKPALAENIFESKAEILAGFHCNAPLISIG